MDSKILHIFTKVVIILAVLILCSSSFVSAFSFGIRNDNNKTSMIGSLIDKLFNNNKEYSLENLKEDLENMKALGNFDMSKITELINKLPAGENKDIMQGIKDMFSKFPGIDGEGGIKTLLDKYVIKNNQETVISPEFANELYPLSYLQTGNKIFGDTPMSLSKEGLQFWKNLISKQSIL